MREHRLRLTQSGSEHRPGGQTAARMAGRVCPLVNDDPSLTEPWCTFPEGIVFMLPVADNDGEESDAAR